MQAHTVHFYKMQGCGNDFVVLTNPGLSYDAWPERAARICDRHFGVGSDGMMIVADASHPEKATEVWMFNPDGSPMGMCGNGIRCLTRYLSLAGIIKGERFTAPFRVLDREIVCEASDFGRMVTVNMGMPSLAPADLPVLLDAPMVRHELEVLGERFECTGVSMGNPHCVVPVPSVESINLERLGPAFEHHPLFPKRVNVEFAEVTSRTQVRIVVWERGAGVTLACGTGACATLVACTVLGLCDGDATVSLPGGDLHIRWAGEGASLFMEGPAREVFEGTLTI